MTTHRVWIDGIALWAPTLPGWDAARAALRGEAPPTDPPARRPVPQVLAAAERRRAPDTVALALEVAAGAAAQAGLDPAALPSVFASAHGDLAINDYMCSTLVAEPSMISPTKFHNSVHNAAAGYWTIGTGCMQASNALTAHTQSFAAGWLEAAAQCVADQHAVLLVGYDVAACGALATVTRSEGLLAVAVAIAPRRGPRSVAAVDWSLDNGSTAPTPIRTPAARALAGNAMAAALPLFEALALQADGPLQLALSPSLGLHLELSHGR